METRSNQKQTLGILVENRPGVLARIVGLLSGRNFNIENITAAETHEPGITRITLVTSGDDQVMDQIINQLRKLINVIKVTDFREKDLSTGDGPHQGLRRGTQQGRDSSHRGHLQGQDRGCEPSLLYA